MMLFAVVSFFPFSFFFATTACVVLPAGPPAQLFSLAVLDNAVSLGAIIFAVHLPSAGQAAVKVGSSAATVANSNNSV